MHADSIQSRCGNVTQCCAGKLTAAETFRLGSIGQLFEDEMEALAEATQRGAV
jgi:hypothetical protein